MSRKRLLVGAVVVLAGAAIMLGARGDAHAGASASPASHPGALIKPIAQYSGDEFYALTRSIPYTPDVVRVRGCKNCNTQTTSTRVAVAGIVADVAPDAVPGAYGAIASRAINIGTGIEALYGMKPGAQFENYLIVRPVLGQRSRWEVYELDVTPGKRHHRLLSSGELRPCAHVHPSKVGWKADFRGCDDLTARPASNAVPLQGGGSPWWIGCAAGCCITSGAPLS